MPYTNYLNFVSTLLSIALIQFFSYAKIGDSEIERAIFTFACWTILFFVFLFTINLVPKKFANTFAYMAHSLLSEGILLFTSVVVAMALYAIKMGSTSVSPNLITDFSLYYFVFAVIVKFFAKEKFIIFITLGGLLLPIVVGFVIGIINFIFRLSGTSIFETTTEPYLMPLFFLDLAFMIGTVWYFALTNMIKNIGVNLNQPQ